MSLTPKHTVCIECEALVLGEVTGIYNDPDNLGGYGGPNPDFGEGQPYTAAIYLPKATEPALVVNLYDQTPEPDEDGHFRFTVNPGQLLEGAEVIPSGVLRVVFTLGEDEYSYEYLATGDIEKRITKCVCCDGTKHTWLLLDLEAARANMCCFKIDEAQKDIDKLYRDTAVCCGCC